MKKIIIICLLIFYLFNECCKSQRVAIIGKGPGGALSSYFLHKVIPVITIDIFNHKPNKETLFSGTMFNSQTVYVNDLIKEKKVPTKNIPVGMIKEGDKFYSSNITKLDGYKLFHKELKEYLTQQLEIFKQIYDFQKEGRTYKTVRELLKSLSADFENYFTNETTENLLINKNSLIADNPVIKKYLKDGLAIHFFDTNAHGFAGLAFLMYSEIIEEFHEVAELKTELFIESLFHSNDKTIEEDVLIIFRENNKNYVVSTDGKQTSYDFIILATTTAAEINFIGFEDPVKIFKYRDAHVLYMTGRLSKKFNKISKDLIPIFDIQTNYSYLQIPYPHTMIYSIDGLKKPSKSDISLYMKSYKIKCNDPVHAPPDYSIKDDESLRNAKFELAENLYNVHAMHSLSLLDEMLAIGAKNIALLIKKRIEEIGTLFFADEQNNSGDRVSLSSIVERSNQTINNRSTSRQRASSSTVGRRLGSVKSKDNRDKSNLSCSKKFI